jgi:hypothetical protein
MSRRRTVLPVLIAFAVLGGGCGSSSPLAVVDGTAPGDVAAEAPPEADAVADGPIRGDAMSDGSAPRDAIAEAPPADAPPADASASETQPVAAACTPGADQTCNDSPIVSALWGMCDAPGVCRCKEGFSINLKTSRCRMGSVCAYAGADPWPTTVMLDHADCAARPVTVCSAQGPTQEQILGGELIAFARKTCGLPPYHTLRVELSSGCPTLLNIKVLAGGTANPMLVACLTQALSRQRWSCPAATDCALGEYDTAP